MEADLEAMLSQMSDKFDQSFADQELISNLVTQTLPQANPQNHPQQQIPTISIKAQIINTDAELLVNDVTSHKAEVIKTKQIVQKQKKKSFVLDKRELQKSSTVQEIKQAAIADYQEEYYDQQSLNLCDKPVYYQQNGNQVDDDLFSYQSLTQKFQIALNKAKQNQSVTLNQSQFSFRQEHYLRKKTTDINLLRAEKEKEIAKQCTAKPLINSRSQKLLINHKPIHARYQNVINQKKRKIQTQVAQKLAKEAQQQEQQIRYIKQHQQEIKKKLGNEIRSGEEYYNQQKNWVETKNKKIEQLAAKKIGQLKQENTFKPEINAKSQILMKKNNDKVPIYEKAVLPKKAKADSNCTFKPNLNKTLKK